MSEVLLKSNLPQWSELLLMREVLLMSELLQESKVLL
jgi:hypothetical protein